MTIVSYIRREGIFSMHALIFGGKTWCHNFKMCSMLDCHNAMGNIQIKTSLTRTEIRREPLNFVRAVSILDKT